MLCFIEHSGHQKQAKHRVIPGNRPSTTLLYPKLTPEILGKIIALYQFCEITNPKKLQMILKKELKNLQILGTIIIGHEGIHGIDVDVDYINHIK